MQLRPFQVTLKSDIVAAWERHKNVLAVSATGSGKTVVMGSVICDEPGAVCAVAHRQELVGQISLALARNGVRHRIIGDAGLLGACSTSHVEDLGTSYIDLNSRVAVAGVDTLIRMNANDPWFRAVRLWVMDEAHHVLQLNKWGRAVDMFPNARGLGFTATPERLDGFGLGAANDGVFHSMVLAPGMREIINMGFLTDYRIFCPPSDLDLSQVPVTPSGEFSAKPLKNATKNSHVTRDVVKEYLRLAAGKLGITFANDIEAATEIAQAFRDEGVSAEVISSKTPDATRRALMRKFRERKLLQLVNVDLMGEGVDVPAIEVVSMARATASFILYAQQFGRALRLMEGKDRAMIIDHVGNVIRHGLPDKPRPWSLGVPIRRNKKLPDENLIPMTVCAKCTMPYELIHKACPNPNCKAVPAIADRKRIELVQGDCTEIPADVLAKMRGEIAIFEAPPRIPSHLDGIIASSLYNKHARRLGAQAELRAVMKLWAGYHRDQGRDDSQIYRLFYLTYGIDMLGAQVLGVKDAEALQARLQARLDELRVVEAHQ